MASIQQLLKNRNNTPNTKDRYFLDAQVTDDVIATSYLGTPIFSNLVFESTEYKDFEDQTQKFDGFRMDVCLMSATTENNIIMTPIQGRNGTVKEMISNGDYKISVQGFLVHPNQNRAPLDQQKSLRDLAKACTSIRVVSAFLNALEVFEVVINAVDFGELEATRNMIGVTINMTSETPIEIRLA